VLKVLKIKF